MAAKKSELIRLAMWLWLALLSPPIIFSALFLLFVSVTFRGSLFALGLIAICVAPSVLYFCSRPYLRIVGLGCGNFGLACLLFCMAKAPGRSDETEQAMVVFGGSTRHSAISPATLVPEVDQQLMGAALFGFVDSSISLKQSKQLRDDITEIYNEFYESKQTADLPSVMGFAYIDLFLGWKPVGNKFVYVPESDSREALPVVVFLHGSLGNFQGYWQVLRQLADSAGVAIVAPTFGAGNWYEDGGMDAVQDAVDWCRDDSRLDSSEIHLAGLSNGGTGVTRAGAKIGGVFRSLIFLSPVLELEVTESKAFQDHWRGKPVLILSGTADKRVPVREIRMVEAGMREAGIGVASSYFEGADHFLFFSERARAINLLEEWLVGLK